MPDIKVLLNNYKEKLILLKVTVDRVTVATESEILEVIALEKDIAEIETMIVEQTKEK